MIKVAIVDDHQMLLEGLKMMLSAEEGIEVIHIYSSGEEILKNFDTEIQVILLDISMPGLSGIEVCKKIKSKYPEIQIVALSMYNQPSYINRMIKAGASGYLLKNSGKKEILTAIRKVVVGDHYFPPKIINALVNLDIHQQSNTPMPTLTRREKQILMLIANEMTTQEIADELHISLNTVESHRKNLLNKLDVRNSIGLVKKAMEKGLI